MENSNNKATDGKRGTWNLPKNARLYFQQCGALTNLLKLSGYSQCSNDYLPKNTYPYNGR